MDNFTLISIAVGVLLILLILIARLKGSSQKSVMENDIQPPPGQNIEYQWVAEPDIANKLLMMLAFAGLVVYAYFTFDLAREILSDLYQMGMIFLGFLGALINGLTRKRMYFFTNRGLYKLERKNDKNKAKPEKVFFWSDVSWVKPGLKGFKYYLEKPTPYNAEVDVSKLFRSSGFVAAGDNAMVVNSIIMSRGIKTSPVPDSSRDAPEFLKGKHYQ